MPPRKITATSTMTETTNTKRKEVLLDEKPKFYLHLDADRDGKVDENPNDLDRWEWGKENRGAVLLVNNNGKALSTTSPISVHIDHDDDSVNGPEDISDLTPLDIRRKGPKPSPEFSVTISVPREEIQYIRIFNGRIANSIEIIGPRTANSYTLPSLDFERLEWGMEAIRYAGKNFNGMVTITLTTKDGDRIVTTQKAKLRVAPWIMFNHFDPPEKIYVMEYSPTFVQALKKAAEPAGVEVVSINPEAWGNDPWMQDIMEFGFSQLPGPPPLRNVLETPRGRELENFPKTLVTKKLGYLKPVEAPKPDSSSLNSGGNLECTPPFRGANGKEYPFGRIYLCSRRERKSNDKLAEEYLDFLAAQIIQSPIEIDAGWLNVGHVDEIISFIPSSSEKGFKLLLSSPKLAFEIIRSIPPDTHILEGRYPSQTTVNTILSLRDLKEHNQHCQSKINTVKNTFIKEMGLSETDIEYVPIIYIPNPKNKLADALTAGMVNMLVLGKHAISPKPFGPIFNGKDLFEEHYKKTLNSNGLTVEFIDDWEPYHLGNGEVHCGTNTLRIPSTKNKWWEFNP